MPRKAGCHGQCEGHDHAEPCRRAERPLEPGCEHQPGVRRFVEDGDIEQSRLRAKGEQEHDA